MQIMSFSSRLACLVKDKMAKQGGNPDRARGEEEGSEAKMERRPSCGVAYMERNDVFQGCPRQTEVEDAKRGSQPTEVDTAYR